MKKSLSTGKALDKTRLSYLVKGLLIGAATGVIVSLFRLCIEYMTERVREVYQLAHTHTFLLVGIVFLSIIIAFVVGQLIVSEPNIKGSGIPQVEGQLAGVIEVHWFSVLWKKFVGGILSVGSGLFLGREGPSIQLGATVGQGASRLFKSTPSEEKVLISSGASAGLSAAFNAPIAGLLFVLEEVHHNFSPMVWLTAFSSAIMSNVISLYFFGLKPVLYLGRLETLPLHYYGALIVLGILLGVFGYLYQVVLLSLPKWYAKLPLPEHYYGLLPLLLVIPIGYYLPQTLGGGNTLVIIAGHQNLGLWVLFGLVVLRFVFSMVSYGANLPGGIFLPILSLGALTGALYGQILVSSFGMDPALVKNFVIVAMAGYFTAIGKAPLTAILLVTEMVGSLNHLMPLGLVALVAYAVNDVLGGNPIYESLLERLLKDKTPAIKGKKILIDYPVTVESSLDGQMIRDFNWPKDMLLVSLRRGTKEILTHGDTVMHAGDLLTIVTDESHAAEVKKMILASSLIAETKANKKA